MALCALAGPNLKYQYAFFPLTLLLALQGLFACVDWAARRWPQPRLLAAGSLGFLALYAGLEFRQLVAVSRSDRSLMNALAPTMAATALRADELRPGSVCLQPGVGFDLVNWYLWPANSAQKIRRWATTEIMIQDFAAHPPVVPGTLVVDYPAAQALPDLGYQPPADWRMVNVREQP